VSRQLEKVAREVMRYLLDNTTATDTLEGIARWRLMQQRIDRTVDETIAAVKLLVRRGFVEEVHTGAGPTLFRLSAARRTEIQSALGRRVS
jgi:hypothetical protein